MDFTINLYYSLLQSLQKNGYSVKSFQEYLENFKRENIILRHDVDKLPQNSLQFANIQTEFGIKGTYFFRIVPESFDPSIIEEIACLGHEIGYHYEDIDLAVKLLRPELGSRQQESDIVGKGIELFEKHLVELRRYADIKTICMHGSPLSRYDNKLLWKYYDYRDFGIIGEPYFDIDFNDVFYLTDTGRKWDGDKVSVRDKISLSQESRYKNQGEKEGIADFSFHSTNQIIQAIESGKFPQKAMLTFHPQRWTNNPIVWTKELVLQNTKNIVKRALIQIRK